MEWQEWRGDIRDAKTRTEILSTVSGFSPVSTTAISVHRRAGGPRALGPDRWTVTHTPTGAAFAESNTREDAQRFVEELLRDENLPDLSHITLKRSPLRDAFQDAVQRTITKLPGVAWR